MSLAAEQIRTDRVAVYIRWSTEDQGEGTTLEVQREACRSFITSQGWAFREDLLFVDDGISGASMERPALARLREEVQRREVDCVVVYKLDRLSRSVLDMLKLVLEEWDGRCAVKSAREPIDTITPTGKMFFYQLMSFAEWERSVIRERMFSGRLRRAQEGRSPGFVMPFGYRKEKGGPVEVAPAAAAVVRRIYRLYLRGMGLRQIAARLDADGLRSATGKRWTQRAIHGILVNPAYAGRLVFGRTRRVKGKVVPAREAHVIHDAFFPVIIAPRDWEAAQALRASRPSPTRGVPGALRSLGSRNLLGGLLRCRCGRSVTGISFAVRGSRYAYYICAGAQATGNHICDCGNIRQADLDAVVAERLRTVFRGPAARERLEQRLAEEVRAQRVLAEQRRREADEEVRRLEESGRRLQGLLIDDRISPAEFRQVSAERNRRLAGARAEARRARIAAEGAARAEGEEQARFALLAQVDGWELLDLGERKRLLRQFLESVTVYRSKATGEVACEIRWRWATADGAESAVELYRQERGRQRQRVGD